MDTTRLCCHLYLAQTLALNVVGEVGSYIESVCRCSSATPRESRGLIKADLRNVRSTLEMTPLAEDPSTSTSAEGFALRWKFARARLFDTD